MARDLRLTLVGKPGCHLCDDARDVVTAVREELAQLPEAPAIAFDEQSILDDEALAERFAEEIPVVLIDGEVHTYWRVDPVRLKAALLG
ncbi:glutaredoxin family protein [Agromyces mediolanus]|uniref:glutaredoxin family protein n=1 Tax=Agromyces mediolanus TaxID=41986 RepID=UPI00203FC1C4|nr:glutaredoxin family protein [Agromyces mediolanus]MCM3657737.1 glutaredoxin family protein [Agromyces mediolanus]